MSASDIPFRPSDSVVAYLRDSGGEDQELSTEQQADVIRQWCQNNQLDLTHVFVDAARQGSSTEKRDAFLEMISYLRDSRNPEKGVVIWSLSRFARSQDDSDYYAASLRRRNKAIWSITEKIPNTAEGRLIEKIYNFSNEKYLENLSIDVKRGLHHNVNTYRSVPGTPPFGFKTTTKVIGVRRDSSPHIVSTWVIDLEKAPIVREAFHMRADGYQIADIHNKLHIFSHRSSYSSFFRNQIYVGRLKFGSLTLDDFCEPIIDQDVWEVVQQLNRAYAARAVSKEKENPLHPRRLNSSYLLSGILYCDRCGTLMIGSSVTSSLDHRSRQYYLCNNAKGKMACDAVRIPKAEVEQIVLTALSDFIRQPDVLMHRESQIEQRSAQYKELLRSRIKQKSAEIEKEQKRLHNITDIIAGRPGAPVTLLDAMIGIEQNINKMSADLERLNVQINAVDVRARTPHEVDELSQKLLTILASNNDSERHAIINLLVQRFDAQRIGNKITGTLYLYDDQPIPNDITSPPPKFMPME